jgi:oxygen-independent coproporphyrinogen-3 oxidase
MLRNQGYDHYEVSNAALPGHRSRHNSAYWQRAPFIGLGPSAHSGYGNERRWNLREWAAYERAVTAGESPVAGRELLDGDATRLEELYLGLRTREGLPAGRLRPEIRGRWEGSGWATCVSDRLQLTPEGWLRLDALVPVADL